MIFDVAGQEFGMYSESLEELPNPDDQRFYSLLEAVNKPFRVVVDTDIPSNLYSISGEVDIIELQSQHSIRQADERDADTEDENDDEEEEFDSETESDEDSPQLSE